MSNSDPSNEDKLGAIRDIIFGSNIEQYNHEFETLKAELDKAKQELENKINDLKVLTADNLSKVEQSLTSSIEAKTKDLDHAKVNREDLANYLEDMANMLRNNSKSKKSDK